MAVEVPWRLRAGLGPCEVDGLLEKRGVGEVTVTCAFWVGAGHKPCLALAPSSPCALERGGNEDRGQRIIGGTRVLHRCGCGYG